jgi:hypothetical protein
MNEMSRRRFLGTTAVGGILAAGGTRVLSGVAEEQGWAPLPPVKIHKVYVGRTGGIYLSRPTGEIEKFEKYLAEIERKLGDVTFVGGDMIPPTEPAALVEKLKDADAVLMFHLSGHGGGAPVLDQIVNAGLPSIVFSQPFSGHCWLYFPRWVKEGKKVVPLTTSNWAELEQAVALLRVPARMRQTRIVVVNAPLGTPPACSAEKVKEVLGSEIVPISIAQTKELHQAVDIKAAEAEAEDYWFSKAKRIVEPTRDEIISSARYYLALKDFMIKERARAVTSSGCMGEPAKGCLAFSKLNDMGLVGACEGDIDSTLTMLIFGYAFGVPGFITDPVFDTARNALIHFHCTSATRMDGPKGERLPFSIRTQTDSHQGVALEVENRVGQVVTCAKFVNLDTMLISTGKIIEVTHDILGCRTQFTTEVKDARSMFHHWGMDMLGNDTMTLLHRAVFYGDHFQAMKNLGMLMGFKVVEEI